MHALTCMARPVEKEVPVSYFDFMNRDSVSMFIVFAVYICFFYLLFCRLTFYFLVISLFLVLGLFLVLTSCRSIYKISYGLS